LSNTLIITRRIITAVFGTLAFQLIEAFHCSVTHCRAWSWGCRGWGRIT